MRFCNKNLTQLQRRSLQLMSSAMIFTVLTNFSTPGLPNPIINLFPSLSQFVVRNGHPSSLLVGSLAVFSILPVLFAVWVAGRYLKAEPDEFIRALVVRALLWGIAVTMAGDAVAGVFINLYSGPFPIGILNADLFFISTTIAFRLVQWSYR